VSWRFLPARAPDDDPEDELLGEALSVTP
jgi:hypothetical protein